MYLGKDDLLVSLVDYVVQRYLGIVLSIFLWNAKEFEFYDMRKATKVAFVVAVYLIFV